MIDLNYAVFRATVSGDIASDSGSIAELFQELSEGTAGEALTNMRDFALSSRVAALVPHLAMKYRAGGPDTEEEEKPAPPLFHVWRDRCLGMDATLILPSDWLEVEMSRRTERRVLEKKNKVSRPKAQRTARVEEWIGVLSGTEVETAKGEDDEDYDRRLSTAFNLSQHDSGFPKPSEAFFITRTQLASYADDRDVDAFQGFANLVRVIMQRSGEVPGAAPEYFAKVAAIFFHVKDSVGDMADGLLPSREGFADLDESSRNKLEEEIKASLNSEVSELIERLFRRLDLDSFPPDLIVIPQRIRELEPGGKYPTFTRF